MILSKCFGKLIINTHLEERNYMKFEQECQRYNDCESNQVSTLSLDANNKQFYKYRDDYVDLIEVPFEFMTIPVGKNYDHALRQRYGNYTEIVKNGSCHGEVIFDTEISYKNFIK